MHPTQPNKEPLEGPVRLGRLARVGVLLSIALVAIGVLGRAAVVAAGAVFPRTVQSDSVWLLSLAMDLFDHGGRLANWSLSPHPNVFPEFLFVVAARWLSHDLQGFFLFYSALALSVFFIIAWFCFFRFARADRRGLGKTSSLFADLTVALLVAVALHSAIFFLLQNGLFLEVLRLPYIPAFHFGGFVVGLLAAFLTIDQFDRPASIRRVVTVTFATLLVVAATLSDKIVVVDVLPGLLAAAVFQIWGSRRVSASVVVSTTTLMAAGLLSLRWADAFWAGIAHTNRYPVDLELGTFGTQILAFLAALFENSSLDLADRGSAAMRRLLVVVVMAGCAWLGVTLVARLRRCWTSTNADALAKAGAMQVFLLVSAISTPIVVASLGLFPDAKFLRLVAPTFFCPLLALATWAIDRMVSGPRAARLVGSFLVLVSATALFAGTLGGASGFTFGDPPIVQCLRHYARRHELRRGLGHHWHSHLTTVASEGSIVVRTIGSDGHIPVWHNNADWYGSGASEDPFSFILISSQKRLDHEGLLTRFGQPDVVLGCPVKGSSSSADSETWSYPAREPMTIWVYSDEKARAMTAELARQQKLLLRHLRRSGRGVESAWAPELASTRTETAGTAPESGCDLRPLPAESDHRRLLGCD